MARKAFVGIVAALFGLAFVSLLGVPPYHADVTYVLFGLALALVGFVGAVVIPGWLFHFGVVASFWVAFYLVNALRYGFLMEGFLNHLFFLCWLALATIPAAVVSTIVRRSRQPNPSLQPTVPPSARS